MTIGFVMCITMGMFVALHHHWLISAITRVFANVLFSLLPSQKIYTEGRI